MSFEYFSRLPAELRVYIWRLALLPREIHAYPPKDVRDVWCLSKTPSKWDSFFNAARLHFQVMPSPLSQVCRESHAVLQGYRDKAPSCDEASLPRWIDWEQDFISCSQEYACLFQNVEWYERIQKMTLRVTEVDEFDEGYQPMTLFTDWLCNLKHVTLLPSAKEGKGCHRSGRDYVWPMEWFVLMEIMYREFDAQFFCEVADVDAPKEKWLTRDNFTTALYSCNFPITYHHPNNIVPPDEEVMRKDPSVQYCLIVTPQMDGEGTFSQFVKIRSDPQPKEAVSH